MRGFLVFATLAAFVAFASAARAEDLLGEPWETPILEGIERQEQEREQRRPEMILRQAELRAARRTDTATHIARLYLLARAYGITGDVASAQATYREVLSRARTCYFVHHDLAMLALQTEPPDAALAERYLRQALQVHPRYLVGTKKLSRLLLETKRPKEAITYLRRVVTLEPDSLPARFLLAQALLGLDRLAEAEREIVVLVRQEPRNPAYLDLKADAYVRKGRFDAAKRIYRRLAEEHAGVVRPLHGYLHCLEGEKEQGQIDPEEWIWVLEGLYRLTRDPEQKDQLKGILEQFRGTLRDEALPPGARREPGEPPSDAEIAILLARAPENLRADMLQYVYARTDAPPSDLLQAVIRRLSPTTESSARVRQWALRVLGRFGGFGLVGLVRHSLGDPDPAVRLVAVDTLMALAETGAPAHGAALLTLGLYVESRDLALARAARTAVLDLTRSVLPGAPDETEAVKRSAFRTWWRSTTAAEAKVAALEPYDKVGDRYPEDILLPYVKDADLYVADQAWCRMAEAAQRLLKADQAWREMPEAERRLAVAQRLEAARREWFRELPPYRAGAMKGPGANEVRARLAAWAARKPRS